MRLYFTRFTPALTRLFINAEALERGRSCTSTVWDRAFCLPHARSRSFFLLLNNSHISSADNG